MTCAAPAQAKNESIGIFHTNGGWQLINRLAEGNTTDYRFGLGATGDVPVAGDWDGDGVDGVGVYRPNGTASSWFLINRAPAVDSAPPSDIAVWSWGNAGDRPVAGDFNGDGKDDIAVYRPSTTDWWIHLSPRNGETAPPAELSVGGYGSAEDLPVTGDWNGDGVDGIGLFRPSTGQWFFVNDIRSRPVNPPSDIVTRFGVSGDLPMAGDWDGDGKDTVGVYRPGTGTWYFTNTVSSAVVPAQANIQFSYWGSSTDKPVAGDWDGRRPECRDGADNDRDGRVDFAGGDFGCRTAHDHPEDYADAPVIWDADGEQPTDQEWASSCVEDGDPGNGGNGIAPPQISSRIAQSTSVFAQGLRSYRLEVRDGDNCGNTNGERAELSQGNPTRTGFTDRLFSPGEDRWISWQILLPSEFPSSGSYWQTIAQWKQAGGLGSPALAIHAERDRFSLFKSATNDGSTSNTTQIWSAPIVKNRWVRFTMHVKFSADPAVGFVELYSDLATPGSMTQLLPRTSTWTMKVDANGTTLQSHARIGIYRQACLAPATCNYDQGTAVAYYDGYAVAATREGAEARAFTR